MSYHRQGRSSAYSQTEALTTPYIIPPYPNHHCYPPPTHPSPFLAVAANAAKAAASQPTATKVRAEKSRQACRLEVQLPGRKQS